MSRLFKKKRKLEVEGKDASEWDAKIVALAEKEKIRVPISQYDYYVNIKKGGWRQARPQLAAERDEAARLRAQPKTLDKLDMKSLYDLRDRARAEGKSYAAVQAQIEVKAAERGFARAPDTLSGWYNRRNDRTPLADEAPKHNKWTGMTKLFRAREAALKEHKDTEEIDDEIGAIAAQRGVPFPRSARHFNALIFRKRKAEKQAKEEAGRHAAPQESPERPARGSDSSPNTVLDHPPVQGV
ncbi:hypothetical protein CBOM_06295 [Ceraceosorus bombacis]|uniref:Uncharacterized protein n=1 Tax=Ceraceosorus bombacis TaxID=401625 RepID=A0A0N7LBF5_9BASI|nr:hypothetical protein CBOM_06295 [Ceraceosorus bombacis]